MPRDGRSGCLHVAPCWRILAHETHLGGGRHEVVVKARRLLKLRLDEPATAGVLVADAEVLPTKGHGHGLLGHLSAHLTSRLHLLIVWKGRIFADELVGLPHLALYIERPSVVASGVCERWHLLALHNILQHIFHGKGGLLLTRREAAHQVVEDLHSTALLDEGPSLHGFTDGQVDIREVADRQHAASGSWRARRHSLQHCIGALEQPLKEAGELAPMILHQVIDVHQLQLDLLGQTLEAPLFDLQVGHAQYLVKNLIDLHRVQVRLGRTASHTFRRIEIHIRCLYL